MALRLLSVRKTLLFSALALGAVNAQAQVRILFDATKGEMAGNADWVIDADQTNLRVGMSGPYISTPGNQSNPQQIPTPAQSTVTSSTPETYWTGAISSWGIDCVHKGYTVETLPWNGQITYGNSSNAQDLSNYKVFIIDEPNLKFSTAEKTALLQFVQNGGGLFVISDHNGSDRNGDGWDSPAIWNDFFATNSVTANPFGITFDLVDISQTSSTVYATSTDSIIHGPMGNVTKVKWSGGTTMTLDPTKNPTVKGVVFKSGSSAGNTNAMVAYGRYGNGRFAAIGDSSPTDDSTGNPACTLYNGYWNDASGNHRLLLMNITIWLAGNTSSGSNVGVYATPAPTVSLNIYPNPSTGLQHIACNTPLSNVTVSVITPDGKEVLHQQAASLAQYEELQISLSKGFYLVKVVSDQLVQTTTVSIK